MKTKHEPNNQATADPTHNRITDIIKDRGWKHLPTHLREDRIPTVSSENTRDQQPGACRREPTMSDRQAICYEVRLENRRVRITTNGETFVIRWKRLRSDRSIKMTEVILTREAAEATMHLIAGLLKETETSYE